MNERMIELYKEAAEFAYKICKDEGRTGGPADHIWNTVSTGKFAELIVRECAGVCEEYRGTEWGKAAECIGEKIKQYFGVEE